jgi:hypothetical protein
LSGGVPGLGFQDRWEEFPVWDCPVVRVLGCVGGAPGLGFPELFGVFGLVGVLGSLELLKGPFNSRRHTCARSVNAVCDRAHARRDAKAHYRKDHAVLN